MTGRDCLEEPTTVTAAAVAAPGVSLLEEGKVTLACHKALTGEEPNGLLTRKHLAPTYDASVLILRQVGLGETAGRVLCRSVPNLCL